MSEQIKNASIRPAGPMPSFAQPAAAPAPAERPIQLGGDRLAVRGHEQHVDLDGLAALVKQLSHRVEALEARAGSQPEAGGLHVVKPGDSLTSIARDYLGDASRYKEIIALNQDHYPGLAKNPDLIRDGWTLVIPANGQPQQPHHHGEPCPPQAHPGQPVAPGMPFHPHHPGMPMHPGHPIQGQPRPLPMPMPEPGLPPEGHGAIRPTPFEIRPRVEGQPARPPFFHHHPHQFTPAAQGPVDVPVDMSHVDLVPDANARLAGQHLAVTGMETSTQTHWTVDGGERVADAQKTRIESVDTDLRERWSEPGFPAEAHPHPMARPGIPVDMHGVNLTPGAETAPVSQETRLKQLDTDTQTHWVVDPATGKPVKGQEGSRVTDAETLSKTHWAPRDGGGHVVVAPHPEMIAQGAMGQLPPALANAQILEQQTEVVGLDTLSDTRWKVGPDGKPSAVGQDTRLTGAETVTRTRWGFGGQGVAHPAPPTPTPAEMPTADRDRLRGELDVYLGNNRDNRAVVDLVKAHPQYLTAASPVQMAQLCERAVKGIFNNEGERNATLAVLQSAAQQGVLPEVLNQLSRDKKLGSVVHTLSNHEAGRSFTKLLLANGSYNDPAFVKNMDTDAVHDLCKVLGWVDGSPTQHVNPRLKAMPEGVKSALVHKLTDGNQTETDHAMGVWIAAHMALPMTVPDMQDR